MSSYGLKEKYYEAYDIPQMQEDVTQLKQDMDNVEISEEELDGRVDAIEDVVLKSQYTILTPTILQNQNFNITTGIVSSNAAMDILVFGNINPEHNYLVSGILPVSYTTALVGYYDEDDNYLGYDPTPYGANTYVDVQLTVPADCAKIYVKYIHNQPIASYGLKDSSEKIYYDLAQFEDDINHLEEKFGAKECINKVIKNGTYITVRSQYSENKDIALRFWQSDTGYNMTPLAVYLGANTLTDEELISQGNLINQISDIVGAVGIKTFWYLYAQHGWQIVKVTNPSVTLDSTDINSVWTDQSGNRFIVGNMGSNFVWFLPEITLVDGIYKASWDRLIAAVPTQFTHVSGGSHSGTVTGTISTPQVRIQTVQSRKFIIDGTEITDDGIYYCDELVISEHILGHNPAEVAYYPEFDYGDSLIDFDRTFIVIGASVTCNTILNCKHNFEITDYRGVIPIMPLKIGEYDSYSFIPKVKKIQDGHRIDMPFDSNVGSTRISAIRNTDDLYDVNDQPDRCICYLKDDGGNYLIGCSGGGSLLRGLTYKSSRNLFLPINHETFTYGGADTAIRNKFYPILLKDAAFDNNVVDTSFIKELSCYYCWFDPSVNDGQVYWYKDSAKFVVYVHCQHNAPKFTVNLPRFMDGMVVEDIVEHTNGSSLLTEQVVSGRVYCCFDATVDAANYIVFTLK